jgi:cytochrome c oxidase subunit 2
MDARTVQSMLSPAGAEAARVAWLYWVMFATLATVFVAVVGAAALALLRSHWSNGLDRAGSDRRMTIGVGAAVAATVLTLTGLLVASILTGRAIQPIDMENMVTVRVTGYQWWWDVEYDAAIAANRIRTANEIHLPEGRPARLLLDSTDVIHSFWAPNLAGKIDLIPGRRNVLHLTPTRRGVYRAQCAEFCGVQHAHMALDVTIESPEEFATWLERQRNTPPPPSGPAGERGRAIVEGGSCALCHRVAGTTAGARTAPDLSHIASRRTIGAGTLPNDRPSLAAWIENPHRFKPGNRMPPSALSRADLDAVVTYLETLR